jgi:hypothetical protein
MPVAEPELNTGVVFWTRAVAVGEGLVTITDPERPPSVCRFRRILGRCCDMVEWYDVDYNRNDWNDRNREKGSHRS